MRFWFFVLILAVGLSSIPLLTSNTYMRSAWSLVQRSVTRRIPSAKKIPVVSTSRHLQPSSTTTHQRTTMTDALPQQNPMPVLEKAGPADPKKAEELPKLSADEFRQYNRLAVMMDAYVSLFASPVCLAVRPNSFTQHNHFRHTWNMIYRVASTGQRPAGVSLRGLIQTGLQLCHHLTIHHTIEEQHIFPELSTRMPGFKDDEILIGQHEQIHEGLEALEAYLRACQSGEKELRMEELKGVMDGFGKVLWEHLDEEVRMLGAENVRKYWSLDEVRRMEW